MLAGGESGWELRVAVEGGSDAGEGLRARVLAVMSQSE